MFVDLEAAIDGADAVAEMAIQAQSVQSIWRRIQTWSANRLGDIRDNVEEVGVSELKVRLRAGMDAGNWSAMATGSLKLWQPTNGRWCWPLTSFPSS